MTEENPQRFEKGLYLEFKSAIGNSDVTKSGKPIDPILDPPGTAPSPLLHAYIVYRDGNGGEQVFRGGPLSDGADVFLNDIQTQNMPLKDSKDAYSQDNPGEFRHRIKLPVPDDELDARRDKIAEVTNQLGKDGHDYDLAPAQNSNSIVATGLHEIGLSMKDLLPAGVSRSQVPGMDNILRPGETNEELLQERRGDLKGPTKTLARYNIEEKSPEANDKMPSPSKAQPHADEAAIRRLGADNLLSGFARLFPEN